MAGRGERIVRRRPQRLLAFTVILATVVAGIAYFLQPAQLTALILTRASHDLKLELHTSGPGSYALRPEPRLVLPGLSARVPGAAEPFFRSGQVELALPWRTLRGSSSDVSRIVLKAPELDLQGLDAWLARQPPSKAPFKLPTLTDGLQATDAIVRGKDWSLRDLQISLPALGDGKALALDARGRWQRATATSAFDLQARASRAAGTSQGLRLDGLQLASKADGELPSLTASGHLLVADTLDLALRGNLQSVPRQWAALTDSSLAKSSDTPFSISLRHRPAEIPVASDATTGWQLALNLGDGKHQPLLTLKAKASGELLIDAKLSAQLSRWPDAWPALPDGLAGASEPLRFTASYHGPIYPRLPVEFALTRGAARLAGEAPIAELRAWLRHPNSAILPPLQATLATPAIDLGPVQLRGVRAELVDDPPPSPPTKP